MQRGDTLSEIAAKNGTSVAALMKANPEIRNANQIYPGQKIDIPPGSGGGATPRVQGPQASVAKAPSAKAAEWKPAAARPTTSETKPVSASVVTNGVLQLSNQDVIDLKKTLATEWDSRNGEDIQAKGIIDTILNRQASGHWGRSVADVVNARKQFSDINGPVAWKHGWHSVDGVPMSRVSVRVDKLVDSYLVERANGAPSSVGTNLNYANPEFSDATNLPWIMALKGPIYGHGQSTHRHGTTPALEKYRPQAYAVQLAGNGPSGLIAAPKRQSSAPQIKTEATSSAVSAANVRNGAEFAAQIERFGNAQARADLAAGKKVVVALRIDTNTKINGGAGKYDDTIAIVWKKADGSYAVKIFSGNTEPSAQYAYNGPKASKGSDTDMNKDGKADLGRLMAGNYRYENDGIYLGNQSFRARGIQAVERDTNQDGFFNSADSNRIDRKGASNSMLIHQGDNNNTWSAGCQTIPKSQYNSFLATLGSQDSFSYVLINASK
ncbi:LysM peptidoglycan-binding domain-containing protein [Sphingorhabdus arenilitoris]|uniref:LysM peptidoglycan-binding domain-containing protein n=1 Tax=Sphingorhabdus arenilitoris TaxID=1490041 RepID=A0ABV8REU6_9SPHN